MKRYVNGEQLKLDYNVCPMNFKTVVCDGDCKKCSAYYTYIKELKLELEEQAECNGKR